MAHVSAACAAASPPVASKESCLAEAQELEEITDFYLLAASANNDPCMAHFLAMHLRHLLSSEYLLFTLPSARQRIQMFIIEHHQR